MTTIPIQKNGYKGVPARPWIRVRLLALDGTAEEVDLLADTGNPCPVIISAIRMARFKRTDGPKLTTNFGLLLGGWLEIHIPELSQTLSILGFENDTFVNAAKASSLDFEGLAGLPLLRTVEFGGNAD